MTTRPPLWTRSFLLATLATFSVFYGFYFLLLALPSYAGTMGASKSQVGFLIALLSLAAAATRVSSARAMNRSPRKRFLLAGLAIFSLAAALHPLAHSYLPLLVLRAVQGVGWGWAITSFGTLASDLAPPLRRGEGIGFWSSAPTLAQALGPLTGGLILVAGGYTWVFASTAALGLLGALLVVPVREPAPPPATDAAVRRRVPGGAIVPSLTLMLSAMSYGALVAFLPLELKDRPGMAGAFFAIYSGGTLAARPLCGWLSDRWGRLALIHPGLLVAAAGLVVLGFAAGPVGMAIAAVLYGMGYGGAAFPGLMSLTVDRSGLEDRAAALAWFFTAFDISLASGSALLGPVYEKFGYLGLNLTAAVAMGLGQMVLLAGIRRERRTRGPAGPAPG